MRQALDAEHGHADSDAAGLQSLAVMSGHALLMAEAADRAAALAADDRSTAFRLGRGFARMEAALSTPGMFGRVAIAQTMREVAPELMDVLGIASARRNTCSGWPARPASTAAPWRCSAT